MRMVLALALSPFTAAFLSSMGLVAAPPPSPGHWVVEDDGNDEIATGVQGAQNYRVRTNVMGYDVTVVARSSSGSITAHTVVEPGTSADIGVPDGGSVEVDDRDLTDDNPETWSNDTGAAGSSGTYNLL